MSCNKYGVQSQSAANALGAGDTEVLQMSARAGAKLWEDAPRIDTSKEIPEVGGIEAALESAKKRDERKPFVIPMDSSGQYTPVNTPQDAIVKARQTGGAAYVYDTNHHPANSPRSPIAVFDKQGRLMMHRQDWAGEINAAGGGR